MSSLHLGSLNPETTVFMLCDIQEKFSSAITFFNEIVTTSQKLVSSLVHVSKNFTDKWECKSKIRTHL